jgi:tyrosine-protein kinase Fer
MLLANPVPQQRWEIRHSDVTLDKRLGSGQFGDVFKATLVGAGGAQVWVWQKHGGKTMTVAVKTLRPGAGAGMLKKKKVEEMMSEGRLMMKHKHKNVVAFYGVAAGRTPIMLIMEQLVNGSLDTFLKHWGGTLTTRQKVNMCIDAATGECAWAAETNVCRTRVPARYPTHPPRHRRPQLSRQRHTRRKDIRLWHVHSRL